MSFKGFSKAISRAPQQFRQKFNMGEITKDAIYQDAERRFKVLETETKKLHEDSKKYSDAINMMLQHQIGFAQAIAEIYKPISGRMSDPNAAQPEGNQAGIEASQEYQKMVKEMQEAISPELEMIQSRIIRPCEELTQVIKLVRKMALKRDHKQVDYDRRKHALKKLQERKDKKPADERQLYQAENQLEEATQEYEYYNEMLKKELPRLFELETEFIRPLFQSFYYMQLNVYWTLNERCHDIKIAYFNLDSDIVEAFHAKRGDVQERAEEIQICKGKYARVAGGAGRFSREKEREASGSSRTYSSRYSHKDDDNDSLPPYSPGSGSAYASAGDTKSAAVSPPPPPSASRPGAFNMQEMRVALYDYEPQAEGDLGFKAGDRIEIIQRSENENEWWTGRCNGAEGVFPGNYTSAA